MTAQYSFASPLGILTLHEKDGTLCALEFGGDVGGEETPLIAQAVAQLTQYFEGKRRAFELPFSPEGTAFQKQVWGALCLIPYGETRCYQQIAQMTGKPKAVRAVGMANHNNPLPIFIPCHRVIGKNGALVGYGGGLPIKIALLKLEKEGISAWTR